MTLISEKRKENILEKALLLYNISQGFPKEHKNENIKKEDISSEKTYTIKTETEILFAWRIIYEAHSTKIQW